MNEARCFCSEVERKKAEAEKGMSCLSLRMRIFGSKGLVERVFF